MTKMTTDDKAAAGMLGCAGAIYVGIAAFWIFIAYLAYRIVMWLVG